MNLLSAAKVADGVQVQTEKEFKTDENGERFLVARWTFEIAENDMECIVSDNVPIQCELEEKYGFPLKIAGSSTFTFNDDRKVKSMKISSWSINGVDLQFPKVAFPDSEKESGAKSNEFETWAKGKLKSLAPEPA